MVKQVGGPGHSDVTVTVRPIDDVLGLIGDDGVGIVDMITWTDNAPGKVNTLVVSLKGVAPVNVVLDFKSVEVGNDKLWTCTKTTTPEIPFAIRQFGADWASRVAKGSLPVTPSVASKRAGNTAHRARQLPDARAPNVQGCR